MPLHEERIERIRRAFFRLLGFLLFFLATAEWIGRLDEINLAFNRQSELADRGPEDHVRRPAQPPSGDFEQVRRPFGRG